MRSLRSTYVQDTYAVTQAVAVRRLAETDSRVISLGQLISEIAGDPERISRRFWVGMFDEDVKQLGEKGFDESVRRSA
jgi:hypothetical protein